MNGKFETDLKLAGTASSRPAFLNKGEIKPCFQGFGKTPVDKEILIMLVIYGPRIVAQSFSSHVGSGSSDHCFDGDSLMVATTSSTVILRKTHRLIAISLTTKNGLPAFHVATRISSIFLSI